MTTRERRRVFGEVADDYDRVRPGYPDRLIDDVLAAAGPGPALEVGAGTGKATVAFADRVDDLTCVEPDTRMAAVLRRRVPGVRVVETPFEDWAPDRGYGLLYAAQSWHWVDNARRNDLLAAALAPGGLFAGMWNVFLLHDPALHAALREVDERHGVENSSHSWLSATFPEQKPFAEEWDTLGLHTDDRFTDLATARYRWTAAYTPSDYRTLLLSTSHYRILDPAVSDAALTETESVIRAHGDTITFDMATELAMARRA